MRFESRRWRPDYNLSQNEFWHCQCAVNQLALTPARLELLRCSRRLEIVEAQPLRLAILVIGHDRFPWSCRPGFVLVQFLFRFFAGFFGLPLLSRAFLLSLIER
jgi:hypothetical protein